MNVRDAQLTLDSAGVFLPEHGITADQLAELSEPLECARTEVVTVDRDLLLAGAEIPESKQPLDAAFYELPERMLAAYRESTESSELGRILACAERLGELTDRVVVLGIGGSYMGAKALMDACRPPYVNELDRAGRGSRPRVYFEGNNLDNDSLQALLSLLPDRQIPGQPENNWSVIVVSKSGGTLETAVALRQFLKALKRSVNGDEQGLCERLVPVTGAVGKLRDLALALGCSEVFDVPEGVGGRFSILSPVGLLPAAVMGLDVVRLLKGAAAMNDRFRSAPIGDNPVLDYVGVCRAMEIERGATIRVLNVWAKSLEAVGLWYDQLLAESLGKQLQGATPITAVNTRDLHSRAQQHQEGRRDKLHTNLIVDNWRADPLTVETSLLDQDHLNELADKTVPELMTAAIDGTRQAYHAGGRPTVDIRLPHVDEFALGQLFQMLMLATIVEGRVIGMNPYGQPGVEAYKQNMNRILGRA